MLKLWISASICTGLSHLEDLAPKKKNALCRSNFPALPKIRETAFSQVHFHMGTYTSYDGDID